MPGCAPIYGSLHMTIQTAVFIDTLKSLSSDHRWCSCNIFSTQEHNVAVEGEKEWYLFLKNGTIPDPISKDNVNFKIDQTIIKHPIEGGETDKWNKIVNACMGVSEDTSMGDHHLYTMEKTFPNHQKL